MRDEHVLQQAGQLTAGPLRVTVHRTADDAAGPYAVLRLRLGDPGTVREVTLRPGEQHQLEGLGPLALLAAVASTRERRGSVRIALPRTPAPALGGDRHDD